MTQGRGPDTPDLFNSSRDFCERVLPGTSIYRLLYEHGDAFFPDALFDDLFSWRGRRSVPPRIVATVMVLQRLEGLSDREAVDRFSFDARWKYACGGLDASYPGFVHTVLVGMRARLRRSESPQRLFEVVLALAGEAGLVGPRRALDSTPLYDAVATQDTVTMLRSAIRGVLRVADTAAEAQLRGVLRRDDSYETPGKPACDWDDSEAREALLDALARDGSAVLDVFDAQSVDEPLGQALELLARILGQDIEEGDDGIFRIVRGVARDRIISTVDPESRHGHKTQSRSFDGYKGHVAIDPDSELITATCVTPGNVGDGEVVGELLDDLLSVEPAEPAEPVDPIVQIDGAGEPDEPTAGGFKARLMRVVAMLVGLAGFHRPQFVDPPESPCPPTLGLASAVWGDASYGSAEVLGLLEEAGIEVFTKVQAPSARKGFFSQSDFDIDLEAETVTCPAQVCVPLRRRGDGSATGRFLGACMSCPLREQCTQAKAGRTVNVHAHFERLHRHRQAQQDEGWKAQYRATRPKVERKLAHLVRRRHGGRKARVRGTQRIAHDFSLLAAATNLARLAQLGLHRHQGAWQTTA